VMPTVAGDADGGLQHDATRAPSGNRPPLDTPTRRCGPSWPSWRLAFRPRRRFWGPASHDEQAC
jgi:hypothetical protein